MNEYNTTIDKKWIYIIASVVLLWMGLGASIAYEAGKHGFEQLDWSSILLPSLPVFIICAFLFVEALRINKKTKT